MLISILFYFIIFLYITLHYIEHQYMLRPLVLILHSRFNIVVYCVDWICTLCSTTAGINRRHHGCYYYRPDSNSSDPFSG